MKGRCKWAGSDPLMIRYHDEEWGVPVRDDRLLFEFLVLEGAQSGLSWSTILNKREGYRTAFSNFDIQSVSRFGEREIRGLLLNPGIVRNRLKVESAVNNANMVLEIRKEFGSFSNYLWSFTGGTPVMNAWKNLKEIPAQTPVSEKMSKDMKKRGFRFVGPTVCYAFMQAVGMVNDHTIDCYRHKEMNLLAAGN